MQANAFIAGRFQAVEKGDDLRVVERAVKHCEGKDARRVGRGRIRLMNFVLHATIIEEMSRRFNAKFT
jgi:hypothetical protein